jgi:hypothetical protein
MVIGGEMLPNSSMERCRQCNSTLAPTEQVCWACNAQVPEKNPKTSMSARFQWVLNGLFVFFAILTVLSIFLPEGYAPPFTRCLVGLLVIFLVRSSSHTMTEAKKR